MFALLSSDSQHANVCSPKLIQRCSVLNMYTRFMFIVFDNCAQNLWLMFFLQRIYIIIDFQKYNKNPYLLIPPSKTTPRTSNSLAVFSQALVLVA